MTKPAHPYTEMLLKAVPKVTQRPSIRLQDVVEGEPPDLLNLPKGCVFHPRCKYAQEICREEHPELRSIAPDRQVSCHLSEELHLQGVFE